MQAGHNKAGLNPFCRSKVEKWSRVPVHVHNHDLRSIRACFLVNHIEQLVGPIIGDVAWGKAYIDLLVYHKRVTVRSDQNNFLCLRGYNRELVYE